MGIVEEDYSDVRDYFYVHILILKLLGIPVKPLEESTSTFMKCSYYIYSVVFIISIPSGFLFMETYASIDNWGNIEKFSSGLSYSLTHLLGKAEF